MTTTTGTTLRSPLLDPCGPVGEAVNSLLAGDPTAAGAAAFGSAAARDEVLAALPTGAALLADLDVQRSWYVLAELDNLGVAGVDDRWSDHPAVAELRMVVGDRIEAAVRDRVGPVQTCTADELPARLHAELEAAEGPPLSRHLATAGTVEHYRDLLRHRSIYHLREADAHTAAIPRLTGRSKAGLLEIQADEYGGGDARRMHSTLFATSMRALGLDDAYAAHVGDLPAVTLAWSNALTLFASRRRLRAAVVGHLLAIESTSSQPNRRYADGLRRLGYGPEATVFFDEHVEADAVHEQVALHDMAVPLLRAEPALSVDLITGLRAALVLDADVSRHLMERWEHADPR